MTAPGERLTIIAEQIDTGQTMADIGTDHGFLPLYLWENKICPKVIMTDISSGSLNKAKEAFKGLSCADIHFRRGDGLEIIEKNEVDVIVIAGMGGVLMTHILGSDIQKALSFGKYVLQPRNGSGKLRYWLEEAGFEIVSESLAKEGKFICEIMRVKPPESVAALPSLDDYEDNIQYEIPRNLAKSNKKIFEAYINKKLNTEKRILEEMICGKTCDIDKKNKIKDRIKFLEEVPDVF